MKNIKLAGVCMAAALVTACGGGGGSDAASAPKMDGILNTKSVTVTQPGPVATAKMGVAVVAGFLGTVSPAVGSFKLPAKVTVDGTEVASGSVEFTLVSGSNGDGTYVGTMAVTAPAAALGVHTVCVTMRPADVYEFDGTGAKPACVTGNVTES